MTRLERLLRKRGLVDDDQLHRAKARQREARRPLVEILLELEIASETELVEVLGEVTRLPILEPDDIDPRPDVQHLIPAEIAQQHGVLPLRLEEEDTVLVIATADPFQLPVFDAIRARTELRLKTMLAPPGLLRQALQSCRVGEEVLEDLLQSPDLATDLRITDEDNQARSGGTARMGGEEAPAIRLVNYMLADGVRRGASDVHVEAEKDALRVRLRLDGVLRDVLTLPAELHAPVLKRLKIVTGLNTIETRRPQDGRAKITTGGKTVDLRISTLPSYFGEKAVIRLLDAGASSFDLERTGLDTPVLATWRELLKSKHGLVLVTGPTGSGKTSTLYASILELRQPSVNIVTVEDPVEYQFPGIVHVPVKHDIGMTFGSALRSILRQDPDVVLLGEIRDKETAEVALRAAVTGHLVLSTLHTNTAAGAITRLLDLGVPGQLVGTALLGVMAQRLVRTVCEDCAAPTSFPPGALRALSPGRVSADAPTRYGKGCAKCFGAGLRGRTAVAELITMSPAMRDLIQRGGATDQDIVRQARSDGALSLADSAVTKVLTGICTPDEVLRVVQAEDVGRQEVATKCCDRCGETLNEGWMRCPACGADANGAAAPAEKPAEATRACACGEALRPGWKLCPACGSPCLEPPSAPTCGTCGEEGKPGQALCFSCGGRLAATAPPKRKGPSILVCDDDAVQRTILVKTLSASGYEGVRAVADGQSALDAIAEETPDLLLVDQEMDGMTGIQVIRTLRKQSDTAGIAVIMLTGVEFDELEGIALDAGADDYLRKPVKPRRLQSRVRALLGRTRRLSA